MFSFKRPSPPSQAILMLAVSAIAANPRQPRRRFGEEGILRLADSIRQHGILSPLCVRKLGDGRDPSYELIAGERRLRAAALLGLERVPCIVMERIDESIGAQLSIVENLLREDLNCFEQAEAMDRLMKTEKMTVAQVGAALSLSSSAVSNKLRLLSLSHTQRNLVLDLGLTERHARTLLRLPNEAHRNAVLRYAGEQGLTVRQTEDLTRRLLDDPEATLKSLCPPSASPAPKEKPLRRFVVKDVRIFINSVDKAVRLIRESGISVSADKREAEDYVEYSIRVPKVTA